MLKYYGVYIDQLITEFKAFDQFQEIGPGILFLINMALTTNAGRSPFHIRALRDEFNQHCTELLNDYQALISSNRLSGRSLGSASTVGLPIDDRFTATDEC